MRLTLCRQCGARVSPDALRCPNCGVSDPGQPTAPRKRLRTPYEGRRPGTWLALFLVILPLLAALLALLF